MLRSRSFDLINRTLEPENGKLPKLRNSIGADLQDLARDRAIITDPNETRRRRTIRLTRHHLRASWGFTLQTYGIRNKRTLEIEVMSYVDYVEMSGPAWLAGMKKGDVILSVNGESVDMCTHRDLVTKIKHAGRELRLVVLFEDCCRKVELQERYIKLKKLLNLKLKELRRLEGEESRLMRGMYSPAMKGENYVSTPTLLSRLSSLRQSGMSRSSIYSTASSDWDMYSEVMSPLSLDNLPVNTFAFEGSMSDVSTVSSRSSAPSSTSSTQGAASPTPSRSELNGTGEQGLSSGRSDRSRRVSVPSKSSSVLSDVGQCEDLDGSGVTAGLYNGEDDSQTSLSGSSPKLSSLAEIMAREEGSGMEAAPSMGDASFRQMYTVARWVGVVGPQSCAPSNGEKRLSVVSLEDPREVMRARSLSSVHEDAEDVGEGEATEGQGRRESDVRDRKASSGTITNGNGTHPPGWRRNFYVESDSESSSVVSADIGKSRRDTIVEARLGGSSASSSDSNINPNNNGGHSSNNDASSSSSNHSREDGNKVNTASPNTDDKVSNNKDSNRPRSISPLATQITSVLSNIDSHSSKNTTIDVDHTDSTAENIPGVDIIGSTAENIPGVDTIDSTAENIPDVDTIDSTAKNIPDVDTIDSTTENIPDADSTDSITHIPTNVANLDNADICPTDGNIEDPGTKDSGKEEDNAAGAAEEVSSELSRSSLDKLRFVDGILVNDVTCTTKL